MMAKPRKPWLAGLLSLIQPGLGHLYCGTWKGAIKGYNLALGILFLAFGFLLWLPLEKINVLICITFVVGVYIFIIQDAVTLARRENNSYPLRPINKWYTYLIFLAVLWIVGGLLLTEVIRPYIGKAYRIPAGSMMPTLEIGDHILTDKMFFRFREPQRGDIITFPFPEDESKVFVKRIVGLPEEMLEIKNKTVLVNGVKLDDESYTQRIDPGIIRKEINPRDNYGPVTIPVGSYFVLGDNRDQSLDSRFWGFVQRDKIEGKVNIIYWSWDGGGVMGDGVRWNRIGQLIS